MLRTDAVKAEVLELELRVEEPEESQRMHSSAIDASPVRHEEHEDVCLPLVGLLDQVGENPWHGKEELIREDREGKASDEGREPEDTHCPLRAHCFHAVGAVVINVMNAGTIFFSGHVLVNGSTAFFVSACSGERQYRLLYFGMAFSGEQQYRFFLSAFSGTVTVMSSRSQARAGHAPLREPDAPGSETQYTVPDRAPQNRRFSGE